MTGKPPIDALLQSAFGEHRAGNLQNAEAGYRALLQRDPKHANAMHLLGVLLHGKGAFREAESLIARAARDLSESPDVLSNLAMASLSTGQAAAALDAAKKALTLAPRHPQALYFCGLAFERLGRPDEALPFYRTALSVQPALSAAREALYRHEEPTGQDIQFLENMVWRHPQAPEWRNALRQGIDAKRPFLGRRGNEAQADVLDMIAESLDRKPPAQRPRPPPEGGFTDRTVTSEATRYLLIRSWGQGFWADVDHVLGQLAVAEIVGRTPVVHWGDNSLYGGMIDRDAFTMYFEPVGPALNSLDLRKQTFYPPKWNADTLGAPNIGQWSGDNSRCSAICFFGRSESIVVSDFFTQVMQVRRWLPERHPLAGQSLDRVYRYLIDKYLRPRAELVSEADAFVRSNFSDQAFLTIHLRGLDKVSECSDLNACNGQLLEDAAALLDRDPCLGIFVMTDDDALLALARRRFGNRTVASDSTRAGGDKGLHFVAGKEQQLRLGREILVDSLVATRGIAFLGVGASNVAAMISMLRAWPSERLTLIGRRQPEIPNLMLNDW